MRKLFSCLFVGFLAAACTTSTGSDPADEEVAEEQPAPEDDVTDEAAGEDVIAVLKGEQPGFAVIVEYPEGTDVDEVTEALAAEYELVITSRYHDLLGAAFIAPDQYVAEQLRLDTRVSSLTEDRLVPLSPGDAFADETDGFIAEAAAAGEADDVDVASQRRSTGWRLIQADRAPGDGSGIRVAVIDTGVHGGHADLMGAVSKTYGKDCVHRKKKTTFDFHGHGTHVSGIIAAQNNGVGMVGVAPGTTIVPVRVFNGEGDTSLSVLTCGVDYVARRADRIHVVNMSLGGYCGNPCQPLGYHKTLRKLVARGVSVVVAAGNDGIDANETEPAYIDEVITVSAYMDADGTISAKDRYANFSNWGPGVDIGAPGVSILSTLPGSRYVRWSGTSMAAPFVAGVAAILVQKNGRSGVRDRLLAAALTSYPGRGTRHPERLLRMPGTGTAETGGCGDAVCDGDEDNVNCPEDCGCAASACASPAPDGCWCDAECEARGDCCSDEGDICPIM